MTKRKRDPLGRENPLDDLDSARLAPRRQCKATSKRTGERCKRFVAIGQVTCNMHGANGRSRAKAAKVIAGASGYAAEMLAEFMADPSVPVKDRVQIAQDLLNRAGIAGKQQLEIGMQTVSEVYANIVLGSLGDPAEDDVSAPLALPDHAEDVIDAEVVEDERNEAVERERQKRRRKGLDPELPPDVARRHERKPPVVDMTEDPRTRPAMPNARADARREYEARLLAKVTPPKDGGRRARTQCSDGA